MIASEHFWLRYFRTEATIERLLLRCMRGGNPPSTQKSMKKTTSKHE